MNGKARPNRCFIDLFAGCGGLALGLMKAGWQGLFAIEKSPLAFETLSHNLVTPKTRWCFDWPSWLPKTAYSIGDFLTDYAKQIELLRGQVGLLAGGPPCQGFSFAGRRNADDERNLLVDKYLEMVKMVQPDLLLLENVRGIAVAFDAGVADSGKPARSQKKGDSQLSAADRIRKDLEEHYHTFSAVVRALDYGVPQYRPRYIMIAVRKDMVAQERAEIPNPFVILERSRLAFLSELGLPAEPIKLQQAISDLEKAHGTEEDPTNKAFRLGKYGLAFGPYQALLRVSRDGRLLPLNGELPDSHRFANHNANTVAMFTKIMQRKQGTQLSKQDREELGIGKHAVTALAADRPSHTLTTLPDDLIHYSEPRIFTVRECARVQSFPDWFSFRGKYTTGANMRKVEVPRYTQVGNAVPPLMAEGIGRGLLAYYDAVLQEDPS